MTTSTSLIQFDEIDSGTDPIVPVINFDNFLLNPKPDASTKNINLKIIDFENRFIQKIKSTTLVLGPVYQWMITDYESHTSIEEEEHNNLTEKMIHNFSSYKEDIFESGMNAEIKNDLIRFLSINVENSLNTLKNIILKGSLDATILNEILIQIGRINDEESLSERLNLLKYFLFHSSLSIRDGAFLGISYMNDEKAIPSLLIARNRESNKYLREDISDLMEELYESNKRLLPQKT